MSPYIKPLFFPCIAAAAEANLLVDLTPLITDGWNRNDMFSFQDIIRKDDHLNDMDFRL